MTNIEFGKPQMDPETIYRITIRARHARSEHHRYLFGLLVRKIEADAAAFFTLLRSALAPRQTIGMGQRRLFAKGSVQ
jgi:hypothetical protein